MQKCVIKGCEDHGRPEEGYHLFLCTGCFHEIDRRIQEIQKKRTQRHANN